MPMCRHSFQLHLRLLSTILLTAIAVPLIGCTGKVSDNTVRRISVTDAARRLESGRSAHLFLDTRPQEAFQAGHVPGARRIELPQIDVKNPDPAFREYKSLIVYGQNPGSVAAMSVTKRLLTAEISDVFLMEEGFDRWKAAGLPVATSP